MPLPERHTRRAICRAPGELSGTASNQPLAVVFGTGIRVLATQRLTPKALRSLLVYGNEPEAVLAERVGNASFILPNFENEREGEN
jgi:hypothetical protein